MADANKKAVTTEELKEELNNVITTETYTINNIFLGDAITTTKGSVTFSFACLGGDGIINFLNCKYDATGTYDDLTTGQTFMSQVMTPTKNYGPFDASIVQNSITYEVRSIWDGIGQKYRYTLIVTTGDEVTNIDIQDVTFTKTNILT